MVIYDQRTTISVTRLSANASLMFSSFSHLFLAVPFHWSSAKLCIYAPAASTILGVFPSPPSWRRPFPKHTKPGRICADICCSEERRWNHSVESCQVCTYYPWVCNCPPRALLCGKKCPMSVWSTMHKVSPCVLRLWLHCASCCVHCNHSDPWRSSIFSKSPTVSHILSVGINEATAAAVKLLGNHEVYFSSWMFRDSFNWVTR